MRSLVLAGLLLLATLAGCVQPAPAALQATSHDAPPTADALASHSPKVDAKATLALLKDYTQSYPYRQSGTPTHQQARDALEKMFKDAGLTTMRQTFPSSIGAAPVPYDGQNILGIKWGQDKTHWIVIGAHYDITEGAVYGTYDDGSGTILVAKLAQAYAKIDTTRTIAFIEFDQEERGLVGSSYFVKSVLVDHSFKAGDITNVTIDGMIDLDMVGITWPHPAHLIAWQNSPTLTNGTKALATLAGVPTDHLEFRKPKGGSSDGAAFLRQNIATIYYWSDWDDYLLPTGSALPLSSGYVGPYPWWHKLDTYDTMVASAGDEATLQKGFQTTLNIVSPMLAYMSGTSWTPDAAETK